jgi:hypothetical protein
MSGRGASKGSMTGMGGMGSTCDAAQYNGMRPVQWHAPTHLVWLCFHDCLHHGHALHACAAPALAEQAGRLRRGREDLREEAQAVQQAARLGGAGTCDHRDPRWVGRAWRGGGVW